MKRAIPVPFRIVEQVELSSDGCWLWTGQLDRYGYGKIKMGGREGVLKKAHRIAYEAFVRPIPGGLEIDHLCRVRRCVNPAHLECVTHRENMLRGNTPSSANVKKTRCPQGHGYDKENTYVDRSGRRHCRACGRIRSQGKRARRKAGQR